MELNRREFLKTSGVALGATDYPRVAEDITRLV